MQIFSTLFGMNGGGCLICGELLICIWYVWMDNIPVLTNPVDCADGEVQLANLASGGVAVLICSNRLLERVCGGGWNNRHAAVVCRQLGFSAEGMFTYILGTCSQ